jgi:hypothetical protein
LHNYSPPEPLKLKKKSRELAGLESSLGDARKPPAEGCQQHRTGKVAESAQLALEGEEIEDWIPIYTAPAISDDHQDGLGDPKYSPAAAMSPLADKWDTAMEQVFDAISQHQVLGDYIELVEGRMALPSHWVYKIKCDGAHNVQQFKARLVCGGNHQIEGIDYQSRCAMTARLRYVRLALVIIGNDDLKVHQMDFWLAFFQVDLEEEIYMLPPQEYFRLVYTGSRYNDPMSKTLWKMVLCLRKSLHGLKPSSHSWYDTIKHIVISIGLVASPIV